MVGGQSLLPDGTFPALRVLAGRTAVKSFVRLFDGCFHVLQDRVVVVSGVTHNFAFGALVRSDVLLPVQVCFRQEVQKQSVGHPVMVQTERIRFRVRSVWMNHPVVCGCWISKPHPKDFVERAAVSREEAAPFVDVVLSVGGSLTQHDFISFMVFDRDFVGVVPTGPNDVISVLKNVSLFFDG